MFLAGLYGLVTGKIKLTKQIALEGKRARVTSLFFIAPLPLILLLTLILKPDLGAPLGTPESNIVMLVDIANPILVFGALVGAVIYAAISKPKTM
jgi:hypothetical protein